MDFGTAFTYVRDDEEGMKKLAVGALLMLLSGLLFGIPALLVLGYRIAVTRNVMRGEKKPLPAWTNFGELFMDGLNVFIGMIVYASPAILLFCIGFSATLLPVLGGGDEDLVGALAGVGFAIYAVLFCLATLVALALAFVSPALHIQYARTGELGSLFRFGEILSMVRQNVANIILIFVAYLVASMLVQLIVSISAITICGPFILLFLGTVWLQLGVAHLYGQMGGQMEGKSAALA